MAFCRVATRAEAPAYVAILRHSTRRIGAETHSKLSSMTRYSPPSVSIPATLPKRPSLELERW